MGKHRGRLMVGAWLGALLLTVWPAWARPVAAHAVVVRAEPAANTQLSASPHEVRIWFTEPLEPNYSSIELRDSMGAVVSTPPSYVEPADATQLVLMTGALDEGLYTVVWRNVSSADGHRQAGSFAFSVGGGEVASTPAVADEVVLTPLDVTARWVNFWALALAVGSIAFIVLVWQPATRTGDTRVPRRLWWLAWIAWLAAGIGAVLLLWNQTAILLNLSWPAALTRDNVTGVLGDTRFGELWLWRMAAWAVTGLLLAGAGRARWIAWLAMVCALAMLLPVSLYSHAAVSNDLALSIFSDWVHLAMTGLWVGGLVALLVAIPEVAHTTQPAAPQLGTLVTHFSNVARLAVMGLVITGIYATWHQVNTLEALTTTFYGQLLIVKVTLALVLVLLAAVNLLWTLRRLMAGQAVWVGRLAALVSLEILVAFAILLVVGAMTAISPARNVIAQREAAAAVPPAPQPQPIHMVQNVDDMQIHFTATPGWVGDSNFVIQLVDLTGAPITNASLIRLRFEHQTENLGESELQIRPQGEAPDGVYTAEGANLSTVGDWRMRVTVQRPDEFDSVTDFEFNVIAPPPPPPPPVVDVNPILPYRTPTLLMVGVLALVAGVYALVEQRFHILRGAAWLGMLLLVLGAAFLWSGFA